MMGGCFCGVYTCALALLGRQAKGDTCILGDAGRSQGFEIFVEDPSEVRGGRPSLEAGDPDPIADENVIQSAVDAPERGAAALRRRGTAQALAS